jgi:hypothetical protein
MTEPAKPSRLKPASFAAALMPPALAVGLYMLGAVAGWWPSMPGMRLWLIGWAVLAGGLAVVGLRWLTSLLLTGVLGLVMLAVTSGVNF